MALRPQAVSKERAESSTRASTSSPGRRSQLEKHWVSWVAVSPSPSTWGKLPLSWYRSPRPAFSRSKTVPVKRRVCPSSRAAGSNPAATNALETAAPLWPPPPGQAPEPAGTPRGAPRRGAEEAGASPPRQRRQRKKRPPSQSGRKFPLEKTVSSSQSPVSATFQTPAGGPARSNLCAPWRRPLPGRQLCPQSCRRLCAPAAPTRPWIPRC